MNRLELTGRAQSHVVEAADLGCALHRRAVEPFRAMRAAAARSGIDLCIASGFRDFARQREVWNRKYRGERALLDASGRRLDTGKLGTAARVDAILLWTALPGASRHHWGTDIDVFDRAAVPPGYRVRLEADEYADGGVFEALTRWLDRHMRRYGFYRPYASGRGAVRPEPWHLSFAPLARVAVRRLDVETLAAALRGSGVLGEGDILTRLGTLHECCVRRVDPPPRMRSRWARPAV